MTSVASLFACHPADVTLERVRELVDVGQPESLTLETVVPASSYG
jgi:hypothetical protein